MFYLLFFTDAELHTNTHTYRRVAPAKQMKPSAYFRLVTNPTMPVAIAIPVFRQQGEQVKSKKRDPMHAFPHIFKQNVNAMLLTEQSHTKGKSSNPSGTRLIRI